jgi:hypothetical protein
LTAKFHEEVMAWEAVGGNIKSELILCYDGINPWVCISIVCNWMMIDASHARHRQRQWFFQQDMSPAPNPMERMMRSTIS